jgi:hypothetical protein
LTQIRMAIAPMWLFVKRGAIGASVHGAFIGTGEERCR